MVTRTVRFPVAKFIVLNGLFLATIWLSVSPCSSGGNETGELYAFSNDRHSFGFIRSDGKVAIEPSFTRVGTFSEGLCDVQIGNKWGYINTEGELVIDARFRDTRSFVSGMAVVAIGEQHYYSWGVIDRNANWVIRPYFQSIQDFNSGFFLATWPVPEGLGEHVVLAHEEPISVDVGFVDKGGDISPWNMDKNYDYFYGFSEGLAVIRRIHDDKYSFGYINVHGEIVIETRFDFAQSFSDGLAAIVINDKWGYIDITGDLVIPNKFDACWPFSDGLASVSTNERWIYIDETGRTVFETPVGTSFASQFCSGVACVQLSGKWGFMDRNGNWIVPPIYDYIPNPHQAFRRKLCKVYVYGSGDDRVFGRSGYVNRHGDWMWWIDA